MEVWSGNIYENSCRVGPWVCRAVKISSILLSINMSNNKKITKCWFCQCLFWWDNSKLYVNLSADFQFFLLFLYLCFSASKYLFIYVYIYLTEPDDPKGGLIGKASKYKIDEKNSSKTFHTQCMFSINTWHPVHPVFTWIIFSRAQDCLDFAQGSSTWQSLEVGIRLVLR